MTNTRGKWMGLWNNSEKHYMVSNPIDVNAIKEFVDGDTFRLILKRNKYYEKDSNKPYYVFAIGNNYGSADNAITSHDMQYRDCENQKEAKQEVIDFIYSLLNEYEEHYTFCGYDFGPCTDGPLRQTYSREDILNILRMLEGE